MPKENQTMASCSCWIPAVGPDGISGPVLMVLRQIFYVSGSLFFVVLVVQIQIDRALKIQILSAWLGPGSLLPPGDSPRYCTRPRGSVLPPAGQNRHFTRGTPRGCPLPIKGGTAAQKSNPKTAFITVSWQRPRTHQGSVHTVHF